MFLDPFQNVKTEPDYEVMTQIIQTLLWFNHRRTGTIRLGGGGALFARKNYAVPHCLIVEISYLLPQNVRKNMRLQSLKGIKLYVIETQFLEPHILYVGLLDLVTIE